MEETELGKAADIFVRAYEDDWNHEQALAYLTKFFRFEPTSCLIAEIDGKAAGVIIAYSYFKKEHLVLFIQEVYVDPEFRHKGVGKALVTQLRNRFEGNPRIKVTPQVQAPTSVLNFYNSLGFEQDQIFSFYYES